MARQLLKASEAAAFTRIACELEEKHGCPQGYDQSVIDAARPFLQGIDEHVRRAAVKGASGLDVRLCLPPSSTELVQYIKRALSMLGYDLGRVQLGQHGPRCTVGEFELRDGDVVDLRIEWPA